MWTLRLFAITLFLACSSADKKAALPTKDLTDTMAVNKDTADIKIHLRKLKNLHIVGDFDGDGRQDTVYEHFFSKRRHAEMDSAIDPFKHEWDVVIKWFYDQDADLLLSLNKRHHKTLHLGTAKGLFCLLNIGDNNSDGKDEIALVTDHCDYSNLNSCSIYTLCGGKWEELFHFAINEYAFDFTANTAPRFTNIPGFLEKEGNKWLYRDYNRTYFEDNSEGDKMLKLKLQGCK